MNPAEPSNLSSSPLLPPFFFYPNPQKNDIPLSDLITVSFSQHGLNFSPPICKNTNLEFNMISTVLIRFREDLKLFELQIYFLATEKRFCNSNQKRIRIIKIFNENEFQAQEFRWKVLNHGEGRKDQQDLGVQILEKKSILVFVNPIGGKGHARRIFRNAQPMLENCGFEIDLVETQYHKHAYDVITGKTKEEMLKYHIIVTISGDGLSHEVLNALQNRPDIVDLIDLPLAFLPGGSGNAMARNVGEMSGTGEGKVIDQLHVLVRGRRRKVDMTEYMMEGGKRVFGTMSFFWGIISDIDIESERFRFLGEGRFTVWGMFRWLWLNKYRARLSYTSGLDAMPNFNDEIFHGPDWVHIDDTFTHLIMGTCPFMSASLRSFPLSKSDDCYIDMQMFQSSNNIGKWNLAKYLLSLDTKGSIIDCKRGRVWPNSGLEYYKIKAFRLEPYGNHLGHFSIDGEKYDAQKIQGIVHPRSLSIISF